MFLFGTFLARDDRLLLVLPHVGLSHPAQVFLDIQSYCWLLGLGQMCMAVPHDTEFATVADDCPRKPSSHGTLLEIECIASDASLSVHQ